MACYISSNQERLYARVESAFGQTAVMSSQYRFPAVKFSVRQQTERPTRRDKTGSRTFPGLPSDLRRQTSFDVRTYMTSWAGAGQPLAYGSLFQAALGNTPKLFTGGVLDTGSSAGTLIFLSAHGLAVGDGVTFGGEIRFVASIPDSRTAVLNQAFSTNPGAGASIAATTSFRPAASLPSISIFSYRGPITALQRYLTGAAIDRMTLTVNGDFHEFQFSGEAKELVDSVSSPGFPNEPTLANFDYSIVPGHLGQAWLGSVPSRFYTLTDAEITLENGIDLRDREFGGGNASCIVAGERSVSLQFSLFERDDEATQSLYQAARERSPVSVMFQLGQQQGQLLGVWMKGVVPEVPEFDDGETRLQWRFAASRAQGNVDDEIFLAFG